MELDLVLAGPGLEQLALSRAERVKIDAVAVPVAHATVLAVMKVLAGRGHNSDYAKPFVWTKTAETILAAVERAKEVADL